MAGAPGSDHGGASAIQMIIEERKDNAQPVIELSAWVKPLTEAFPKTA
jgi:hypothetical protein